METPSARLMVSAPTNTPAMKIAAGTTASGIEAGEHGDDDAGIAEAARQVGGEIALEPRDLGGAGEPGERAGEQRRR